MTRWDSCMSKRPWGNRNDATSMTDTNNFWSSSNHWISSIDRSIDRWVKNDEKSEVFSSSSIYDEQMSRRFLIEDRSVSCLGHLMIDEPLCFSHRVLHLLLIITMIFSSPSSTKYHFSSLRLNKDSVKKKPPDLFLVPFFLFSLFSSSSFSCRKSIIEMQFYLELRSSLSSSSLILS